VKGDEAGRAVEFLGKHRAHSDVFGSSVEGGVKLLAVSDEALGGPAAGGTVGLVQAVSS
jgi:hypothetical protein